MKWCKWTQRDISALKRSYKDYPVKYPEWLIERHGKAGCQTQSWRMKFCHGIRNPGLDLRYLTIAQKAYFAGIIDGEGSIIMNYDKPKTNPSILVANTDFRVMEWIRKVFSPVGLKITYRIRKRENPKWKDVYQLHIHGVKNVYDILRAIEPYLVIKKDKSVKARQFLKRKYDL